jgi:hypothetical protein
LSGYVASPIQKTAKPMASEASQPQLPVGYKNPPVHSRFKPGESGNPTGRAKGSENLKTLFNKILSEEVSVREGAGVRKVSKAEALLRGVVLGALKGDPRNMAMLLRVAEQAGGFEDQPSSITRIERVIVSWKQPEESSEDAEGRDG